MKKIILICLTALFIVSSCTKWERGEICTSVDKTNVQINEKITVSSCGDEPPSEYVETKIDWGDGTTTSGLSGSHEYSSSGCYYIKILLNGDFAADVAEVDESKVKHKIIVQ
jgi:hypothetical protein